MTAVDLTPASLLDPLYYLHNARQVLRWSLAHHGDLLLAQLECAPLFERIRLMFFGNLHQDWSEFVLKELGHQQYETVALDPASRAFAHREEVDLYLKIHHCHSQLEEGEPIEAIEAQLPPASSNPWLENRRQRLLFALGQRAERVGELDRALGLYRRNGRRHALIRELRLLEKQAPSQEVFDRARQALDQVQQPEARISLGRILSRAATAGACPT